MNQESRSAMRSSNLLLLSAILLTSACRKPTDDVASLLSEREELDETIWADEVAANNYEQTFVDLWDAIRVAEDKFEPFQNFDFTSLSIPATFGNEISLELGVTESRFDGEGEQRQLTPESARALIDTLKKEGWRIIQTDWHHTQFIPIGKASSAPESVIDFNIHAIQPSLKKAVMLDGRLLVEWSKAPKIKVTRLRKLERAGGGFFSPLFTEKGKAGEFTTCNPIIVYDLNGDGLSEIILARWNRVLWNRGGMRFDRETLLSHPQPFWESAIIADMNGDAHPDLIVVSKEGYPLIYEGDADGKFTTEPKKIADVHFDLPSVITTGDIDGDGDLDLWMTQYKLSFDEGQMPTPYYDANDGYPSYLLRNDGDGKFTDITENAGLGKFRHRRSYAASFIDLDNDGDSDLVNTSDYAGTDIYRNSGDGKFELATESFIDERHSFGMAHSFADYDGDGNLDFYVIGMSSTTARRLDALGLSNDERPDIAKMRSAMGYGNRLYFGTKDRFIEREQVASQVARTGWSWGVTSADFDLDGDRDIYVANGYRSGKSTHDYCSTFWRHDIYTGGSAADPKVEELFRSSLAQLNNLKVSWNGYEKNNFLLNQNDKPGQFTNIGFLLGIGFNYDARSVVSDDLDADGRPDLIVSRSIFDGRGFVISVNAYRNELEIESGREWVGLRAHQSGALKVKLHMKGSSAQSHWFVTGDSFASQHAPVAHFGIPAGSSAVEFEVLLGDGTSKRIPVTESSRYYGIGK